MTRSGAEQGPGPRPIRTFAIFYLAMLALTAVLVLAPLRLGEAAARTPPPAPPGGALRPRAVVAPEPSELARDAHWTGNALWALGHVRRFGLLGLAITSGAAAAIATRAAGSSGPGIGAVSGFLAFELVWTLVQLPFAILLGFVRPRLLGLSSQTPARFAEHLALGTAVDLAIGAVGVGLVFALMARSGRRWGLAAWGALVPVAFVVVLVKPVWIDPLFQEFGPMRDKVLEGRILGLAARCGVAADRVFEVDQSKDTKAVNAYVAGLLGTRRIVLWSTLVDRLEPDEVLAVMAHELGHDRLGHMATGFSLSLVAGLAGMLLLAYLHGRLVETRGAAWGIPAPAAPAAWPLLRGLVLLLTLAGSPLELAAARTIEHQADVFALELTRDNDAIARAFVKLQVENLAVPRPGWLFQVLRSTHPSLGERIDFAATYRPWETGEPLAYAQYLVGS